MNAWRDYRGIPSHKLLWASLLLTLPTGCSLKSETSSGEREAVTGIKVKARFDLAPGPMKFGAIPWPDDLYLDAEGRISVAELPAEGTDNAYLHSLRESLLDLDGFGAASPVYFYFDGPIDPRTVDKGSVFLMDMETGSPESLERIPVTFNWHEPDLQLAVRAADDHPFRAGHKYAAVVTAGVRGAGGSSVEAADTFAAIRDSRSAPGDDLPAAAYDHYAPVISALVDQGFAADRIAALAVFRVRSAEADLQDARKLVRARKAPFPSISSVYSGSDMDRLLGSPEPNAVGLDSPGGAPHDNLGWMAQGSLGSPYLLSRTVNGPGCFTRDDSGALQVKLEGTVPFSLWLPRPGANVSLDELPVVIIQHGLGGERSDALSLANALAAGGFAVIALDAPFHGLRLRADEVDVESRFTGAKQPDGFGDIRGSDAIDAYAGLGEGQGKLVDFNGDGIADYLHPYYWRDATRQGVVDLLSAVYLLQKGDWSALGSFDAELRKLHFSADRIGFVGIDIGAQMGVLLASFEPGVDALFLAFPGGLVMEDLIESPAYQALAGELFKLIGRDQEQLDAKLYNSYQPRFWPELALWQTLVGRGDALAYTYTLRRQEADVLIAMAQDDEVVTNPNTISLARALAADPFTGEQLDQAMARGEFPKQDRTGARALFEFETGTHDLLFLRQGTVKWEHPIEPPFRARPEQKISNPIESALDMVARFFRSWRDSAASASGL